jgi:predicted GNAT family acetyltransferase
MAWTITPNVTEYAAAVRSFLEQDPAENTVALTVLGAVEAGTRFSDVAPSFGWYVEDGAVAGSFSLTPPFELLLVSMPRSAVPSLAAALRDANVEVPGVNGRRELVEDFVSQWLPDADRADWREQRERLYELGELVFPDPMPAGHGRVAVAADFSTLLDWFIAFHEEATRHRGAGHDELVRSRIAQGLVWVWELDGELVAMAGRNVTAAGTARVGPVYTPPAHRRHGYGAAVTAACTADALSRDAERVVLFTDLANPTSNAIYQAIGYRPRSDRVVYRFDGGD